MRLLASALAIAAALLAVGSGAAATVPSRVWGVTLDNDAGIGKTALANQVSALAALPSRPVARVVADIGTTPDDFASSLPALHKVSDVVLELGDSSEVKGVAPSAYGAWVRSLTARYAGDVSIWEIGNEVNGEWVGKPAQEMARVAAAAAAVHAIGGKTMLTLYYNPACWAKRSNALFRWLAARHVSRTLTSQLDYVTISYYPGDCNKYWPSNAKWQQVFDKLHAGFPHADLGFGEAGTSSPSLGVAARLKLWNRYVAVPVTGDRYVGLGLWWTWAEDAVPMTKQFWHGYAAALQTG